MSEPLEVQQNTQFQLDLKTLIGLLAGFLSIAGVYFTLTSEIAQLQIDNIRVQASVLLNEEFRIKWPLEAVEALIQKHFNEHDEQ